MLRVLGRATSGNVQKVLFFLEETGIPYSREDYGRQFNNTGGDYLKLNPNGKVPTIVDGDTVVWESHTILRYLANKHGKTDLYPADFAKRTDVERWMDWLLASMNYQYVQVFKDSKNEPAKRAPTFAADAKELGTQLSLLDGAMAGKPFIAGNALSLADIAMGPIVHRCLDFPIGLPPLTNLRAWRDRLKAMPSFQKATKG
ncbi:MAG TPA: glutathione S-transferase family protein [Candidatus Cybelea sp.]|nr:glutathione S-transferase family protein [Candidatus Cybelea sp.]